jgi:hypothetical protein
MSQPLTEEWMEQLGREDGAAVADWIVDELGLGGTPDRSRRVGKSAVGRIKQLVRKYEERGVSESLIEVWRKACVAEIYRRFAVLRAQAEDTDTESAAPDPVTRSEPPAERSGPG